MSKKPPPPYILFPATIIIDTREQSPWQFRGFRTKHAQYGKLPLIVPVEVATLSTGDYSLAGFEADGICIERKSHEDAVSTFCHGRERFERELERMQKFKASHVVIEADWPRIMHNPPKHSKFTPKSFRESVVAWINRYPLTHWHVMPTRADAEKITFQILRRFWKDEVEAKEAVAKGHKNSSSPQP